MIAGHFQHFPNPCMLSGFNRVQLFATPSTIACQPPLSMGFPRQVYWRGLLFPPPGDLPTPGIEPECPALVHGFLQTLSHLRILGMAVYGFC